jgi:hypothetical protein
MCIFGHNFKNELDETVSAGICGQNFIKSTPEVERGHFLDEGQLGGVHVRQILGRGLKNNNN